MRVRSSSHCDYRYVNKTHVQMIKTVYNVSALKIDDEGGGCRWGTTTTTTIIDITKSVINDKLIQDCICICELVYCGTIFTVVFRTSERI